MYELLLDRQLCLPGLVRAAAHVQAHPACRPTAICSAAVDRSCDGASAWHQLPQHRASRHACAASADYGADLSVVQSSYLALGLAHCFEKDGAGKLADRLVIEPLAANSLECMANGASTCFKAVTSVTYEDALQKDRSVLPQQFSDATWCQDFDFRAAAAARTWQRPHAQDNLMDIVPLGQVRSSFNYNVERKRVLNFVNIVTDDDNVKQDLSIDVYGRKEKADEEEAQAAADPKKQEEAPTAKVEEEDDDLDALLTV